ncbi:MAG: VCBS repeat-containing protein [Candidatus Sulfotelmatobacter sp.]
MIGVIALSSILPAQVEAPSAQTSHRFFERRAELIRQHSKNATAAPIGYTSGPLRSPDAPVAQRYVFGRLDLPTGLDPFAIATGIFKTGGPLSIAVANYDADTVSIYLANGDGTFQPPIDYATGFAPDSIFVADFNGDNKQDLAVADWASDTVSIFVGNGDGTFQPVSIIQSAPATSHPWSLRISIMTANSTSRRPARLRLRSPLAAEAVKDAPGIRILASDCSCRINGIPGSSLMCCGARSGIVKGDNASAGGTDKSVSDRTGINIISRDVPAVLMPVP